MRRASVYEGSATPSASVRSSAPSEGRFLKRSTRTSWPMDGMAATVAHESRERNIALLKFVDREAHSEHLRRRREHASIGRYRRLRVPGQGSGTELRLQTTERRQS